MGNMASAMDYVSAASEAGADAVKFQWFHDPSPGTMFCWMPGDEERAKRWRQSAMPVEDWRRVGYFADFLGIDLLASCFEYETIEWLHTVGISVTKVASRAALTFPYE